MKEIFLLADDQEGPAQRRSFLEMAGYQVTVVEDTNQCLALLDERKPAVVLMDVLLHGKTGFELCRDIRVKVPAEEVPIVLCTEIYRSRVFQEEALGAGAQAYLLKPISLDELVRHVGEVIKQAELSRSERAAA